MAIVERASAQDMSHFFAEAIRNEPAARRLWFWSEVGRIEPGRLYVEFWVLIDQDDDETFRRVAGVGMQLHERFPEAIIRVHVVSPETAGPGEPPVGIRQEAAEISFRSA